MTNLLRLCAVAVLTSVPALACAQPPTVSPTNPYLRMCDGVLRPVAADSVKNYRPARTASGTLCWVVRRDSVVPPVVVPTPVPTPVPVPVPPTTALDSLPWLTPVLPLQNGWRIAYDASSVTVQNDPSGLPALAMRFPAGYAGGSSPATVYREGFSVAKIRWESTLSYPVGYVKHSSSVDKVVFVQVNERNLMYTMMYDPTRLVPAIGLQGIVNLGSSVNLTPNIVTSAELFRGRRHNLTCEAQGNTSGQANGTVECWLDGTKVLSRTGIQFTPGDARFTGIAVSPIWGGAGGSLPAAQSIYFGGLKVSGR